MKTKYQHAHTSHVIESISNNRDHRSTLLRFQPKMKVVNCMQSMCKILHTVSKIFCVFFFTCLFRACITCVISMQYGRFTGKKHACNAAIPVACAVLIVRMYTPHLEILVRALIIEHHFDVIRKIVSNITENFDKNNNLILICPS